MKTEHADVDGIPVVWIEPAAAPTGAAIWLTHLGGSTQQTLPMLTRLAERGVLAVSFDPPGHGERGSGDPWAYANGVLGAFPRRMWPLLGQTTLECLRVLDWIDDTFAISGPRLAGGISMGGDVAVALAGIDAAVGRVSALVATPDWTRPGIRALGDGNEVIDQGVADAYAQRFYDALNPLTHLDAYGRDVAISFQCGAADTHVPADGAVRFRAGLVERFPGAAHRINVDIHARATHLAVDERFYDNAVAWLTAP